MIFTTSNPFVFNQHPRRINHCCVRVRSQPRSGLHVRCDQRRRDVRTDGRMQSGQHIHLRLRRALPQRLGHRPGGQRLEMGRVQRGPRLRHGIRPEVFGCPGIGCRRSSEPYESAQQQGRPKGARII